MLFVDHHAVVVGFGLRSEDTSPERAHVLLSTLSQSGLDVIVLIQKRGLRFLCYVRLIFVIKLNCLRSKHLQFTSLSTLKETQVTAVHCVNLYFER